MESQCVKAESAELMPVNGSLLLRPVSVVAVDEDPVARWVRASTSAQGLPEKVSDPDLLLALVALITRATQSRRIADRSAIRASGRFAGAPASPSPALQEAG